jgi:hypothetical protein
MGKKISPPTINSDESVFIAGMTGSGKTVLARNYLAGYDNVAVLDTKGLLSWSEIPNTQWTGRKNHILVDGGRNLTLVDSVSQLGGVTTPKIIYRPSPQEMSIEYYDTFFQWCYQRGETIVWIDELMSVCPNPMVIPFWLKAIYTRGREWNVAAWGLSQRPSGIPLVCMSEPLHMFVFDLNLERDRKRVAEIGECPEMEVKPGKYNFWYHRQGEERAYKARLVLNH